MKRDIGWYLRYVVTSEKKMNNITIKYIKNKTKL